jgi:mono/diheme cytochrome c family protein
MRYGRLRYAGLLVVALLLASCGSGSNSGDVFPWAATAITPTSGPDSFLLFPNPQKQADGSLQTNTTAYATAYYAAIDPANAKDTLDKWKAANGFGNSATGTETTVVFGDVKDLGYGRRMTARKNNDGTIAVMVENYLVSAAANYTYSSFNLDAAVVRDQRWHVGTNGIEYSPPPGVPVTANCGNCYAKFSNFNATTGQRQLMADLDGRGDKAMPGICISCHGGRADPLKYDGTFPRSVTSFPGASDKDALAGDVQAHLQPLEVGTFDFSTTPGYTRADQEAALKTINKLVLCSYPLPTGTTSADPDDACRPVAGPNSWQGTAAEMIKSWYGDTGSGLQNSTFSDTYVPQTDTIGAGWAAATGQTPLYQNVIAKSCRVCHALRGTANMDEINFRSFCVDDGTGACNTTYPGYFFTGYADRVKAHVIDRGNMPLGKIIYERFWDSTQPDTLATFLESQGQSVHSNGVLLTPGRPVADPGPDRTTISGDTLSAANSLFASTYNWSVSSGGVLSNPTSAQTTLSGPNGTYVVQLVVGNGTTPSAPVQINVTIATPGTAALPIAPANIHFADIKAILQGTVPIPPANSINFPDFQGCTGCHSHTDPQAIGGIPPIFYDNYDRDGLNGTDPNDDNWFYNDLRGRINFTDVAASPLLRKPTGNHHYGGFILNSTDTTPCASPAYPACSPYATLGDYFKAQYNKIVLWILNGAPY